MLAAVKYENLFIRIDILQKRGRFPNFDFISALKEQLEEAPEKTVPDRDEFMENGALEAG